MDLIKESNCLVIPNHILFDKNLTSSEKIVLSQIYWYDKNTNCHASNRHLANLLNITIRPLQRILSNLRKKGYLTTNGERHRILKINHANISTPCQFGHANISTPMSKLAPPPCQNEHSDHANISTPIIKNRIKNIKKNIYCEDAQKVLDYLNKKKASKYSRKDEIIARLKEGRTVDDCILVIENKFKNGWFLEHPEYLRPTTLFAKSHFDDYLNENTMQPQNKKQETLAERYMREKGLTEEELKKGERKDGRSIFS